MVLEADIDGDGQVTESKFALFYYFLNFARLLFLLLFDLI